MSGTDSTARAGLKRWHIVVGLLALALTVLLLLFDWNWFRHPLERYITDKTQRTFHISNLDVDIGFTPTIKVKDVYFENAQWSTSGSPMARIGSLEFSISLRDLWDGHILVPRVALSDAELVLERAKDDKKNWVLQAPAETGQSSTFRISSLSVGKATLRYVDHKEPFVVDIQASTFEPGAEKKALDAKAPADNRQYTTRFAFTGKYHEAGFSGDALTGDVLSFMESDIPFPIRGKLQAGTTKLEIEGSIADVVNISAIDVQLHIAGRTLATLYPFLLLPLPASPPYDFRGHLILKGNRFAIDNLQGQIGSTDIAGSGAYVRQKPRPLLTAKLHSKLLNISDLGPIIGLETKDTAATGASAQSLPVAHAKPATPAAKPASRPQQGESNTREQAQAKERVVAGEKILPTGMAAPKGSGILPSGEFEGGRLRAIDAEVDYAAAKLKAPAAVAVEDMKFRFRLHDAVAKLAPLEFGYAGGRIVSEITIDARQEKALHSTFNADFRNLQLSKLFPTLPGAARGVGGLGAQIRLQGAGNSIAAAAGASKGSASAILSKGRLSNLVDAFAGLNGGKILALLVGGDKDIALNCGAAAFSVHNGLGQSELFVVDTEQTRIDGKGTFNLKDELLDFTVEPKPKRPGIFSLRTPLHLKGTFRHPDAGLDKGPLIARAGGAALLALVNPLAALIPLIETGPGTDADCRAALAQVPSNAHVKALAKGVAPKRAASSGR
ncbi:MAG: AsmA family protein [Burkholderiaceae bacterium]